MNRETITKAARDLRKKCGVLPPERLCSVLGIGLLLYPMGSGAGSIKGFMRRDCRICTIVVNSDQPEEIQSIVGYHEIGHIVLRHYETQKCCAFHEFSLFDGRSQMENEANTFVAEYLLDDNATISCLKEYQDIFSASSFLHVPPEILAYKLRILKDDGKISANIPITVNSSFMGKIKLDGIIGDDYA